MADAPGFILLPAQTITTAVTGVTTGSSGGAAGLLVGNNVDTLVAQASFVYGSGGTNLTAYLQTSLDAGLTWIDIMSFQFLLASATKIQTVIMQTPQLTPVTPTDGSLSANTAVSGMIGDRFRIKYTSTGTYAGSTTIAVVVFFNNSGNT